MWTRIGGLMAATLVMTACGVSPAQAPPSTADPPAAAAAPQRSVLQVGVGGGYDRGDRGDDRDGRYGRRRGDREIPVVNAYSSSDYRNTRAFNAIDGSTDTMWANAGYQERRAWVVLQFDRNRAIDHVEIKTGVLPGVRYRLEVATSRGDWHPVTGWLRADSWQLQRVQVNDRGRYLRVVFENSRYNPQPRFWLYAIRAYGEDRFGRYDARDRYDGDWDSFRRRGWS